MITKELLNPSSIVVVGGSNNVQKPGGKVLKNLIDNNFQGDLYVSNPKEVQVQGIASYRNPAELPQVDLAIMAIAAKYTPETVKILAEQKKTRAFVILSAGYSEESEEGASLERQVTEIANKHQASVIGPNCIGVMNAGYAGVFTTPIPDLDPAGVDFISGSGATAVFIIESGMPKGLKFSSVYSVGNSAQLGVEDILKHMDETFDPEKSSKIKLLYIESIEKPRLLLKHARSLRSKGCKIAAVKAGGSEAGSRAASSHTGALASSDAAVGALFRKAGIVRCYGREELTNVASVFMHKEMQGNRMAVITHAGGPAVMLTDALSDNGMQVPPIEGGKADALLKKLYPGSSVANPIDFLATGTAGQLEQIIEAVENDFDHIDGMAVIFGSPGLFDVYDVYKLLNDKIKSSSKPIYPILPSVVNVREEIEYFKNLGNVYFPDEVAFGHALTRVVNTPEAAGEQPLPAGMDEKAIRKVIDEVDGGYIPARQVYRLLDAAGIQRAAEEVVTNGKQAVDFARQHGFPVVMKVVGPLHKSDVGGVALDVNDEDTIRAEFKRLMNIPDTNAVLVGQMIKGTEIFIGAKEEPKFGHMVLAGLGGIFIEVLKDVNTAIAPVSKTEAMDMVHRLKGYKIIQGARGQEPVNEDMFAEAIMRVSALATIAPEIKEMDLNPLLGANDHVTAVDYRLRIEK